MSKINYKTISTYAKFNHNELNILRHLSRRCMSIYKKSLRHIKDNYELNNNYLNKYDNWDMISKDGMFFDVNNEIKQRACFMADYSYKSYFELLKLKKNNKYDKDVLPPDYPKSRYMNISFSYIGKKIDNKGRRYFIIPLSVPHKNILRLESEESIKLKRLGVNPDYFDICSNPFIKITIPRALYNKKIKEVTLIPLYNGKRFKIQYKYVDDKRYELAKGNDVLSIDLGVNNLFTCVTTKGDSFIVDGKRLKSMNQYYNKRTSELKSNNPYVITPYKDIFGKTLYKRSLRCNLKQNEKYKEYKTKRMLRLLLKRDNKISDYIDKSCNMIIKYCLSNNISKLVLGYNNNLGNGGFKYPDNYEELNNMGKHYVKENIKKKNQHLLGIPFGKIRNRLTYLCSKHKIEIIIQEESYTSVSSFYDNDFIPVYDKDNIIEYSFSGKRVYRGLYKTKNGYKFNADINGALNILRKSSVCDEDVISNLSRRGVNTPIRLRVI